MLILALSCLSGLIPNILGAKLVFTELETLKPSQKIELDKFKKTVFSIVPFKYMTEDIYLVKWLQVTGFNTIKAEEMLKQSLNWRQEVNIDDWEDPSTFADFDNSGEYPLYNDGVDRVGKPILEAFYGKWNLQWAAMEGKIDHLGYYYLREVERSNKKIREFQAQGKNVTQWILLLNMGGFNVMQGACPACTSFHTNVLSLYEKNWPNTAFRTILINTPESFEVILKLSRPLMSPQTRDGLKVFGKNRTEWKPYLDKLIDPSEISNWYDPRGKERGPI